jgi:hypothetical protein
VYKAPRAARKAKATRKIGFVPIRSVCRPTKIATGTITSCAATMQAAVSEVA